MSDIEKLKEMIKNDYAFMSQLKEVGDDAEVAAKLIDEYAIKHGFDPEEIDKEELEAVAGGFDPLSFLAVTGAITVGYHLCRWVRSLVR